MKLSLKTLILFLEEGDSYPHQLCHGCKILDLEVEGVKRGGV